MKKRNINLKNEKASSYNDYYLKIQHQTDIIALYDNSNRIL